MLRPLALDGILTITFLADCLAMSEAVLQESAGEESAFKQLVD